MKEQLSKFRYVFYILLHPFDGFYDLKHEKRGSGLVATLIYVLVGITALLKRQCSEYLFNQEQGESYNAVMLLLTTVGPYLLWCVANWCFTSLMDGEGGMKDVLFENLAFTYFNFGWELPGTYDVGATIHEINVEIVEE